MWTYGVQNVVDFQVPRDVVVASNLRHSYAAQFRGIVKLCSLDFEKFQDIDSVNETTHRELQWPKIAS